MSTAQAGGAQTELFAHEVRRDGRPIVTLRGVATGGAAVVEVEVHPIGDEPDAEPLRRPFPFGSSPHARRFADEALTALEYLGCTVVE